MTKNYEKSQALHRRASQVMPLGVTSNFRYWGEGETPVAARAKGGYVWDPDGNRYIDYRLGFGPVILGHADPEVNGAVAEAINDGTVYALTTEREVRVAEKIVAMVPNVDMVRFATSGSEATMHALRVARAYTGREKVIKFEGQYHGMYDYVLWSTAGSTDSASVFGNRHNPIPIQSSSGIPSMIRDLIISLPYNDIEVLEQTVRQAWHDVACIILEPMMGNVSSVEPTAEFLEAIRSLCDEYGIVFIFDEVKTGFRVGPGGAQEYYNASPDLSTFAKSMGNGFPIAAFGGKREIMEIIGKGVSHGGTYTGNTVGVAAAEKTLDILANTDALETVAARGRQLRKGISDILETYGVPFVFTGHPSMFGVHFSESVPRDFRDWLNSDHAVYDSILEELVHLGAMPDPDSREPWFFCRDHSEADIDETLNMFADAAKIVLE